jgi:mediator of RNA polymerase II transcription subunit 21
VACLFYTNHHHDYQTLNNLDVVRQDPKPGEIKDRKLPFFLYQLRYGFFWSSHAYASAVEPHPPEVFKAGQKELARDLIIKEQQIEYLISVLPGLENSEKDQEEMIQQLEVELREAEVKRKEALKEKEAVLARLEAVIRSVKRP